MGATLIAYECTAHDHAPSLIHPDKLTIHQGRWAFCAFDARADGHEWRETGGADMGALLHRVGLAAAASAADAASEAHALKR